MAIAIKSIAVLKSEAAEAFEKKVYANNDKRATIDFSEDQEKEYLDYPQDHQLHTS